MTDSTLSIKPLLKLISLTLILSFSSCSSVKVVNSWQSDKVETIKPKNILVIARTANDKIRVDYENEISKQLRAKNLKVTESYKKFPKLDPNNKLTEEKVNSIKKMFQEEGFNAVVISVLKDIEELSVTTTEGGYEAGASLSTYYYWSNFGFYGYYVDPVAYPSFEGVYKPETMTTETARIFVLETSAFNLDLPEKDQLMAVVTSKIEESDNIYNLAEEYAKAIIKSLKKK